MIFLVSLGFITSTPSFIQTASTFFSHVVVSYDHIVRDHILSIVDSRLHSELQMIMSKNRTSFNAKRIALLRCGVPKLVVDEIELFSSPGGRLRFSFSF